MSAVFYGLRGLGIALARPEARVAGAPRQGLVGRRRLIGVSETSLCIGRTGVSSKGGNRAVRSELGLAISFSLQQVLGVDPV